MNAMLTKAEIAAMDAAKLFTDPAAMKQLAPSLFATHAHPRMSQTYAFTNTYDIILHIHNRGYHVSSIAGGETNYRKLLVRMRSRHHDQGDYAPEIVVMDSHDGSRRLKVCLGFINGVCLNGMIAGDMLYARTYTHRSRDLMAQVLLDLTDIDPHVEKLNSSVKQMKDFRTTETERLALADHAIRARYSKEQDESFIARMRPLMLRPRRADDRASDMYTVMNVVQENVLRGGMHYVSNNRMQSVRSISDVNRNMSINQALWNKADELMSQRYLPAA